MIDFDLRVKLAALLQLVAGAVLKEPITAAGVFASASALDGLMDCLSQAIGYPENRDLVDHDPWIKDAEGDGWARCSGRAIRG